MAGDRKAVSRMYALQIFSSLIYITCACKYKFKHMYSALSGCHVSVRGKIDVVEP